MLDVPCSMFDVQLVVPQNSIFHLPIVNPQLI
jgi:hypothetical protein